MSLRLRLLLLSLLLVFAQTGSTLHALSHWQEEIHPPEHSQHDQNHPQDSQCKLCLAFLGIGSALPAQAPAPAPEQPQPCAPTTPPQPALPGTPAVYDTRAPPSDPV